jgi:hypothetical protein
MARKQNTPRKFDPQAEAERIDCREQALDDALRGTFPRAILPPPLLRIARRTDAAGSWSDVPLDYPRKGSISKL